MKNEYKDLFREFLAPKKDFYSWNRCWCLETSVDNGTHVRYIVEFRKELGKFYVQTEFDGCIGTRLDKEKCIVFEDLEQAMLTHMMVNDE